MGRLPASAEGAQVNTTAICPNWVHPWLAKRPAVPEWRSKTDVELRSQPERIGHGQHPGSLERFEGVVDGDLPAPEVAQRKPVASRLRAGAPALHLAQVPVQPLVEIDKPQDVPARAEPDLLGRPGEFHAGPWLPPGADVHELVERPERLRNPDDDPADVELTQAGKVWPGPVPKGLDHDAVVPRRGQPGQGAAYVRHLEPGQVAPDQKAHRGRLAGALLERRHGTPHRSVVEVQLLGQRERLAAKACSDSRHDEQAHGLIHKRPLLGVYPPRRDRVVAIRQAFSGWCFARKTKRRWNSAWQEPWAFGEKAEDLRSPQEERHEQVSGRSHFERAGQKEQVGRTANTPSFGGAQGQAGIRPPQVWRADSSHSKGAALGTRHHAVQPDPRRWLLCGRRCGA